MDLLWSAGKATLGAAQVAFGFKKAVLVGLAGFSFGNAQASVIAWRMGKEQMEKGSKRFMEGVSEVTKHLNGKRR
jgi:hypothetical protein